MNNFIRNFFGILISALIILITLGLLFNSLTRKSFYDESGVVKVKGISNRVNVYKTELGVSHIFAENEKDMYFSLGYIHARDRLWQMDIERRVAEGRLSEIFGKDVLEYDILFRTLSINKASSKIYSNLSAESKAILDSYSSGINFFIEQNSKKLPLEFDILNYKPDQWKPEESVMIIRLMAWELNLSWYSDVMFGEIIKKLGPEKAKDFFPDYPEDAPFIIKNETDKSKIDTSRNTNKKIGMNNFEMEELMKNYKSYSELGKNYFDISKSFREYFGMEGVHAGSNSWVISGNKTETGKPLLANDPHLALTVPAKWYEVSLYNNQKKYSVCGFSIPGVPAVAIGHNDVVSWGLTNLMCDDTDFFILKRDSADKKKYIYKNETLTIDSTLESIKIKDTPDDFLFTTYRTKLGPVISNLEKTGFLNNQKIANNNPDEILTFRWTGYEQSDELETFYKINNASDWSAFRNALTTYGAPGLNFVYADTSGNIAYQAAGFIPIRTNSESASEAFYPSNQEASWSGFIPFNELPSSLNPKEGYIVTANNKPQKNYKYYISNLYEPPYRTQRIEDLIQSNPVISVSELKRMQNDVLSLQAVEFCKYLFESFGDSANLTGDIKSYVNLLKQWDYEFKANSSAATLFAEYEVQLYKNLYNEALGNELFENYIYLKNIPVKNTSKILKQNSSSLFENNFVKEQIIRKSFYDAVSNLISKYGTEINKWQWGEVHEVKMEHPLGSVPALSSMLNIGPFKIPGSGTTINNLEYGFSGALKNTKFNAYLGPSMRMIVDLSEIKTYLSIIPTGQSGQPLHRNYNDQARLWLNGDYKKVSTDFEDLKKESLKLLALEPDN